VLIFSFVLAESVSFVKNKPEIFRYSEGGFNSPRLDIKWARGELKVSRSRCANEFEDIIFVPTDVVWRKFQTNLETLGFWQWRKEYVDEFIMDGTQIEIDIKFRHRKKVFCSNQFPEEMLEFTACLSELLGNNNLEPFF